MGDYEEDRTWSDKYIDQIKKIIEFVAADILSITIASDVEDTKSATDFVIKIEDGNIAVRLRRSNYSFRDLTIRAERDTGTETELSKIKRGFGRFYLYGWLNEENKIFNWILVDLNKVRILDLLENRNLISNNDGTYFIAISAKELEKNNCLIASVL